MRKKIKIKLIFHSYQLVYSRTFVKAKSIEKKTDRNVTFWILCANRVKWAIVLLKVIYSQSFTQDIFETICLSNCNAHALLVWSNIIHWYIYQIFFVFWESFAFVVSHPCHFNKIRKCMFDRRRKQFPSRKLPSSSSSSSSSSFFSFLMRWLFDRGKIRWIE